MHTNNSFGTAGRMNVIALGEIQESKAFGVYLRKIEVHVRW